MSEQWVGLAIAVFTFLNLILSGRAASGMAATRKAVRGLVSVIGHPRDQIVSTSLIEQVHALAENVGAFQDDYKRSQDNIIGQLRMVQANQGNHDQPPIRDSIADASQAGRDRY